MIISPIKLCKNKCCPTVKSSSKYKGEYIITDDYNGEIRLKPTEIVKLASEVLNDCESEMIASNKDD